jgi:hypothetical protein
MNQQTNNKIHTHEKLERVITEITSIRSPLFTNSYRLTYTQKEQSIVITMLE